MFLEILLSVTVFYALTGLLIGSFLNVCIYRIPRGESVAAGRSHCPACGHVLGPLDLVPVISFFALSKKCRYCQAPISSRYAAIEAYTALIFAFSGFALTALGLQMDLAFNVLSLLPFIDVIVLAVALTWMMIRLDRRTAWLPGTSSPHTRALQIFFAIDLLHIWIFWLLLG